MIWLRLVISSAGPLSRQAREGGRRASCVGCAHEARRPGESRRACLARRWWSATCLRKKGSKSKDKVGLLLHFSSSLPRVLGLRGGVRMARRSLFRPGDRRAIREGVPAREPRPSRCRGFLRNPLIFLDYLASFRQFHDAPRSQVGLFLRFIRASCPLEVLRVTQDTSRRCRIAARRPFASLRATSWRCRSSNRCA